MTLNAPPINQPYIPIISVCFLVALLEGFDIQAIGVAGPSLVNSFNLSSSQAGRVFALGMVGIVLGAGVGGWLSEKMGRRQLLSISVLVFGVFTLAMVTANSVNSLMIYRFAIGLGLGAAMPVMITIAVETSPTHLRTRTVTIMFCGMPAGGAIAALVARQILGDYGWQPLFVIGGILPIITCPLLWLVLSKKQYENTPKTLNDINSTEPLEVLFGSGRGVTTTLVWISYFMTLMILYLMLNWLPLLVVGAQLGAQTASTSAFAFNAASIAGAIIVGYWVDKRGSIVPIATAYLGVTVSLCAMSTATTALGILITSALVGFFLMGAQYSLYGITPMFYPAPGRSSSVGASVAVGRIGSILGPFAAGKLLAWGLSASAVALSTAPVAVIAGIAAVTVSKISKTYEN